MLSRSLRSSQRVLKHNVAHQLRTNCTAAQSVSFTKVTGFATCLALTSITAGSIAWNVSNEAHSKSSEQVPHTGIPGTKHERTFIAIKPDGVQRGLIHEVIARFEKKGYKLVAMRFMTASEQRAREHYADLSSRPFFPGLVNYFTSGPIVIMVWEGTDVIVTGRKILGATNPNQAAPGTLRGDNCISTGRNLIHGSDGPESAKHEIAMWFPADQVQDYSRALDSWIVADN